MHVTVTTSGAFNNPVASVIRWSGDGDSSANLIEGLCNGPVPGLNRTDVPINGYIDVAAGQQYAIQVGGAKSPNNAGGTVLTPATTRSSSMYDPDSDGDGLFDSQDQCDFEAGPAALDGCPDNDGDGIANKDDLCPNLAGGPTHQGCPDADGDSVPEGGPGQVPRHEPRSREPQRHATADGCPDTLRQRRRRRTLAAIGTANGILFDQFFVIKRVPKGARVVVKCKLPSGSRCGKLTVKRAAAAAGAPVRAKAARNLEVRSVIGRSLPYGTTITVRVTATLRDRAFHPPQGRAVRKPALGADLLHEAGLEEAAKEGLCVSAGRTRLALAAAAVVLFGASFAVGKASGGDDSSEDPAAKPKSAEQVEVPDSAANVPSVASVGALPKLKPKPEPESSTTTRAPTTIEHRHLEHRTPRAPTPRPPTPRAHDTSSTATTEHQTPRAPRLQARQRVHDDHHDRRLTVDR